MKHLLRLTAFVFFLSFLVAGSCNKEDPPPPTKTELLTKASWKFSVATVGGSDVSAALQACQRDNIITFASNGSGTNDEGLSKCNPGDPQSNAFTWNFLTNETQLFISSTLFTGGSNTFTIVTLSETELVLSQTITVLGTPQTVTVKFVH